MDPSAFVVATPNLAHASGCPVMFFLTFVSAPEMSSKDTSTRSDAYFIFWISSVVKPVRWASVFSSSAFWTASYPILTRAPPAAAAAPETGASFFPKSVTLSPTSCSFPPTACSSCFATDPKSRMDPCRLFKDCSSSAIWRSRASICALTSGVWSASFSWRSASFSVSSFFLVSSIAFFRRSCFCFRRFTFVGSSFRSLSTSFKAA